MLAISPRRRDELARALAENRRLAEAACQADALNDIRAALNAGWDARRRALEILNAAEGEAIEAALADIEHRSAA